MEFIGYKICAFIVLVALVIGIGIKLSAGTSDALEGATSQYENMLTNAIADTGVPTDY